MATVQLYPSKDAQIVNVSYANRYMYQDGRGKNLWLGSWDWESQPSTNLYAYQSRALLKFNLPVLPAGTVVTQATLNMYLIKYDHMGTWNSSIYNPNQTPTLGVYNILQDWDEGIGDGATAGYQGTGATWTNRTAIGNSWTTSGGYFDSTPIVSVTDAWESHLWQFDIKTVVNSWYATPSSNYGVLVKYVNDTIAQGALWCGSREGTTLVPYLELTYNTPPEQPRGLVPNFGSFVSNDLPHTTQFKWNFIDTVGTPAKGKADFVFLIDVTKSMWWRLDQIRDEIGRFIDRLIANGVDWQIGLVAFSDVHYGDPIRKWGWFSNKQDVITQYNRMPRLDGGDWPESGLDAIMDATNGAMSFVFRSDATKQFFIATDAPFHNRSGIDTYYSNYSTYELSEVITALQTADITTHLNANTYGTIYTQLHQISLGTGGEYIEETVGWAPYLPIKTVMSADELSKWDQGDVQTRADLRVWKINSDTTRTLIWSYTVNSAVQELYTKDLNMLLEEGSSYEWDVTCYDSQGTASVSSDKATFTCIVDVNIAIGIPMYNEPLVVGSTINKNALLEFRAKLYDEVNKYPDLDPNQVLTLFEGEVVPSKSDMIKLRTIMNSMLIDEGLAPLTEDLVTKPTFGVSDVDAIRKKLIEISYSPPDNPTGGTAQRSLGIMYKPLNIISNNDSSTDTTIEVIWSPAEYKPGGWNVQLSTAQDTDINYYKFYYEQIINYADKPKYMLTEVYMKAEQVIDNHIYVPDTGSVDQERMWYHAYDMNGRVSQVESTVALDPSTVIGSATATTVSSYVVEVQQKAWGALHLDPAGSWSQIYAGTSTSTIHTVSAEGSYWYRVKAIDSLGNSTDWTYTVDTTYIKF